jgi:hypothetical protein
MSGPLRTRWLLPPVLVLITTFFGASLFGSAGFGSEALAHGGLVVGVPGPGQTAGGDIDVVQLLFLEEIVDAEVALLGPDGVEILGNLEQPTIDLLEYVVPPLEVEGAYVVEYDVVFADELSLESAYQFSYEPGAPAVIPIEVENRRTGTSRSTQIAVAVLAGSALGLLGLLSWRLRELRAAKASSTS